MTNSVQPAFVPALPSGDSSQYVMVDKTKITAVITQLLSLLSELHQAPPAPIYPSSAPSNPGPAQSNYEEPNLVGTNSIVSNNEDPHPSGQGLGLVEILKQMTSNLASTANTSIMTKLNTPVPATQAPTIDNSPSMSRAQNGDFTEPHHKSSNQISINVDDLNTSSPHLQRNLTRNDSLKQPVQPLFTPTTKSSAQAVEDKASEKQESADQQEQVEPMHTRNDKKRNIFKMSGEALKRLTTL